MGNNCLQFQIAHSIRTSVPNPKAFMLYITVSFLWNIYNFFEEKYVDAS